MRNPLGFVTELFKQPMWVVIWVNALVVVNLISAIYLSHPLAQVILGVFIFQAVLMMAIYSYYGFEKILGLAHFLWFPLLAYILFTISSFSGDFFYYLITLSAFLAISLVFDIYDVISFFRQNKAN